MTTTSDRDKKGEIGQLSDDRAWYQPAATAAGLPEYAGLLAIGDPHLASRVPGFRKDDYPVTVLKKLAFCFEYARQEKLLPILLGDLFHWPRDNANWILTRLFTLLQGEVLAIAGNHDCSENQLSEQDSLSLFVAAGKIRLLENHPWRGRINGHDLLIGGTAWSQRLGTSFTLTMPNANPANLSEKAAASAIYLKPAERKPILPPAATTAESDLQPIVPTTTSTTASQKGKSTKPRSKKKNGGTSASSDRALESSAVAAPAPATAPESSAILTAVPPIPAVPCWSVTDAFSVWEVPPPATVVWITHHDLKFQGYEAAGRYRLKPVPGVGLVINGHIHRPLPAVVVDNTRWLNPGNITRIHRGDSSRDRQPQALRLEWHDDHWHETSVLIPHEDFAAVFHEALWEEQISAEPSLFVRGLEELLRRRTQSGAGMEAFLQANLAGLDQPVQSEIWALWNEVSQASL